MTGMTVGSPPHVVGIAFVDLRSTRGIHPSGSLPFGGRENLPRTTFPESLHPRFGGDRKRPCERFRSVFYEAIWSAVFCRAAFPYRGGTRGRCSSATELSSAAMRLCRST